MKRIIAGLCLCAMLFTTTVFAALSFPDLPEGHWAFTSVDKMVNDGRVNGFPDGEFKPDELVTRWQFAKMAGGDPDVMTEPDRAATRDEAVLYLWERAGKPSGVAPSVVTKESKTPDAVAWAYSVGIMKGDDGLNLRLSSTLTRAEAACLIVRAEDNLSRADFKDTVSGVILERVFNAMQTGISYQADKTITNGELAHLALCIAYDNNTPNYMNLKEQPKFSGKYAKDVQLVAQECWGEEFATEAFMNSKASIKNAVAALSLYTMKQATGGISLNPAAAYEDASFDSNGGKLGLSYANTNGISLIAENKIEANRTASLKDLACILLQLDEIGGLHRTYGKTAGHSKLMKDLYQWPVNAEDYAMILADVPTWVYETPLIAEAKTVDGYEFARDFSSILANFLSQIFAEFPADVKVTWTLYPSMVARVGTEAIIRVRLDIQQNPDNLTLNQLFKKNSFAENYAGNKFFVDISTGKNSIGDVVIKTTDYTALRAFSL